MRLTRLWSGQYEIVTGPLSPLRAADALVFTRETIVNIAAKHELHATFSPRVYKDTCNFPTSPLKTRSLSCVGHRRHRSAYARIRTSHSSASCKSSSRKSEHKQKDDDDAFGAILPAVTSRKPSFQYRVFVTYCGIIRPRARWYLVVWHLRLLGEG